MMLNLRLPAARVLCTLLICGVALASACEPHEGAPMDEGDIADQATPASGSAVEDAVPGPPSGVEYEIIEDTDQQLFPDVRRNLVVQLEEPASEDELRQLSLHLRHEGPRAYDQTFISYYLPGMLTDDVAWATGNFLPDLEVRILGLEDDEVSDLAALEAEHGDALQGAWVGRALGAAGVYVLTREAGSYHLERLLDDGGVIEIPVEETASGEGLRLDVTRSAVDEYYLIRGDYLELWDEYGLVFRAEPLDP